MQQRRERGSRDGRAAYHVALGGAVIEHGLGRTVAALAPGMLRRTLQQQESCVCDVHLSLLVKVKPRLSWPARKHTVAAHAGLACKLWFNQMVYMEIEGRCGRSEKMHSPGQPASSHSSPPAHLYKHPPARQEWSPLAALHNGADAAPAS